MSFQPPFLTYPRIKQEANKFLAKHHPSLSLPIPIEEIIDIQLGIHVFCLPRLYKDYGQNGYISSLLPATRHTL